MIRVLHLADIHLGARLYHIPDEKKRDEIRSDLKKTFTDIITFCITPESRIDIVLICGNLFDSHVPGAELLDFVRQQFNRLLEKNILLFLVPGAYDSNIYSDSVYKHPYFLRTVRCITQANFSLIQTVELKGEKINLYGMAYSHFTMDPADVIQKVDKPGYHIALMNNSTTYGRPFLDIDKLKNTGFDYIALGGEANYSACETESTKVVYPGMLEPVKSGATDARRLCVFECTDGRIKLYPLENKFNQKEYILLSINLQTGNFMSEMEVAAFLEEKYTNYAHLLKLELTGKISFLLNPDRLKQRLSHFFFHLEIDDQTEFDHRHYLSQLKDNGRIEALYIEKMNALLSTEETDEAKKKILQAMNIGLTLHEN